MQQWMRAAAVFAGLAVAGGVFGTIAGTLVLLAWFIRMEGFHVTFDDLGFALIFGIFFGGGPGAILGPLLAFWMMRGVPLWLAVGGTTVGTVASGGLALLITGHPPFALVVGVIGFIVSAGVLNDRFSVDEKRLIES